MIRCRAPRVLHPIPKPLSVSVLAVLAFAGTCGSGVLSDRSKPAGGGEFRVLLPVVPLVETVRLSVYRRGVSGLPMFEARGLVSDHVFSLVRLSTPQRASTYADTGGGDQP